MQMMPHTNQHQVRFALQAMLRFAGVVKKNRVLPLETAKRIEEHSLTLMAQLEREERSAESIAEELNRLITVLNQALPAAPMGAKFPAFNQEDPSLQVKSEVVAFELYLNQLLRGGYLPLKEEGPLFEEALVLWRDLGLLLSPKQGMQKLSELIAKLNKVQSEDDYPSPDTNAYGN